MRVATKSTVALAAALALAALVVMAAAPTTAEQAQASLRANIRSSLKSHARATTTTADKPHIVVMLLDDWGWNSLGYHTASPNETFTPNLDALAAEGIKLNRYYSFRECGPSRAALQSGRHPIHVAYKNTQPETYNPDDPVSGFQGIPRNMTCMGNLLKEAGYRTVATGKWDVGMATMEHTPLGRGYDAAEVFYHHATDYWKSGVSILAIGEINVCYNRFTDAWNNAGPATNVPVGGDVYQEDVSATHTIEAIKNHDPSTPLFLFHSFRLVHTPLQVPSDVLEMFQGFDSMERRLYAAMTYYADGLAGDIVRALKDKKMYDNTLIVVMSDNGGPLYTMSGGNNYPLRGGKYADFEGGVRSNAFVSGGLVPAARRNTVLNDFIHISDWYATFVHLANFGTGEAPADEMRALLFDPRAAQAGLPQVDSIDAWPVLAGLPSAASAKRTEVHISLQSLVDKDGWKVLVGNQTQVLWTGPFYPNKTGAQPSYPAEPEFNVDCGERGCLFNVFADETEHHDVAGEPDKAAILTTLLNRLAELNKSFFNPNRGEPTTTACEYAEKMYGGYYGPFVDVPFVPHVATVGGVAVN